jgi:hypothetical protein
MTPGPNAGPSWPAPCPAKSPSEVSELERRDTIPSPGMSEAPPSTKRERGLEIPTQPRAPKVDESQEEPPQPGMRVGELRARLDGLPDDMLVTVRAEATEYGGVCGGIFSAGVELGCDDVQHFAIDVSDDFEDFEESST